MGKFDFIKNGNNFFGHDPGHGLSSGIYTVIFAPEKVDSDSIILIASDYSEAEVLPCECHR